MIAFTAAAGVLFLRHGAFSKSSSRHKAPCIPRRRVFVACASSDSNVSNPISVQPPSQPSLLIRVSALATNLFPLWIVLGAATAFIHPPAFLWFGPRYISPTLSFIMLGMGLTLPPSAFGSLLRRPQRLVLGSLAQFSLMPLLAYFLSRAFSLPAPLAAGVILVGCAPGGAASNLICLLANGDVAYSVLLTLLSTLLSAAVLPILMRVLAGALVPISILALFRSTARLVLLPLLIGALLRRIAPSSAGPAQAILPPLSGAAVALICASVVAGSSSALRSSALQLIIPLGAMHILGGVGGYLVAAVAKLPCAQRRSLSIEVMMQNSTLAVALATAHFASPLTAVPGAVSATMHSLLGAMVAGVWRSRDRANRQ